MKLIATFEKINKTVTIDVTSGDIITPREVEFGFQKMFDGNQITLLAYPLETILAEKIETILSRGIASTRPRDYYDVYILLKLKSKQIDFLALRQALENTMLKRQSTFNTSDYESILNEIKDSNFQQTLWSKYQKQFSYAKDIDYEEVIAASKNMISKVL